MTNMQLNTAPLSTSIKKINVHVNL